MKPRDIRALGTEELGRKLDQTYKEWFNLRFQWAQHQLEDHNRITALRRDIARIKTILRERELALEMATMSGGGEEGGA